MYAIGSGLPPHCAGSVLPLSIGAMTQETPMLRVYRKAHWSLSLSISVFLLLDVSVLLTNSWLSRQIDRDAVSINLAGRQRMLSQELSSRVLVLHHYSLTARERESLTKGLMQSFRLFDQTLVALMSGGAVTDTSGARIELTRLDSAPSVQLLQDARQSWMHWRPMFIALDGADAAQQRSLLQPLESFALDGSSTIQTLMNQLTTQLQHEAQAKTASIRRFQSVAMVLALINFVLIIFLFRRHIEAVRRNNRFLDRIIDRIDTSVLIHRKDGQILSGNQPARQMFGCDNAELEQQNLHQILQLRNGELVGSRCDGGLDFYAEIQTATLDGMGDDICITTVHDVTGQKELQNSLHQKAYHDPLTGLPNRLLIHDRLAAAIARARRYSEQFAVFFIDLDGFKNVNDHYGHEVGDGLLLEVAACLKACTRETDTLGRLGGDEFVMILCNIAKEDNALQVARKVIQKIREIELVGACEVRISASVGIAMFPEHGTTPAELMKHSDAAMYLAKHNGKDGFRVAEFSDEPISVEG
jgi:diguanylate cyclase (GGDEF)-like protein